MDRSGQPHTCEPPTDEQRHHFDIFLSHYGRETKGIMAVLYFALQELGVHPFLDIYSIKGTPELTIQGAAHYSRTALLMLSPGYLSSSWCVLEANTFIQRHRKSPAPGKCLFLPVFFECTVPMSLSCGRRKS